jgi:hypothetical protein
MLSEAGLTKIVSSLDAVFAEVKTHKSTFQCHTLVMPCICSPIPKPRYAKRLPVQASGSRRCPSPPRLSPRPCSPSSSNNTPGAWPCNTLSNAGTVNQRAKDKNTTMKPIAFVPTEENGAPLDKLCELSKSSTDDLLNLLLDIPLQQSTREGDTSLLKFVAGPTCETVRLVTVPAADYDKLLNKLSGYAN